MVWAWQCNLTALDLSACDIADRGVCVCVLLPLFVCVCYCRCVCVYVCVTTFVGVSRVYLLVYACVFRRCEARRRCHVRHPPHPAAPRSLTPPHPLPPPCAACPRLPRRKSLQLGVLHLGGNLAISEASRARLWGCCHPLLRLPGLPPPPQPRPPLLQELQALFRRLHEAPVCDSDG